MSSIYRLKLLETPRLNIRHHKKDDFEQYIESENYSAKDLKSWFGWINQERGYNSREEIKGYFSYLDDIHTTASPRQLHFFIFKKDSDKYIGSVIFFRVDWDIPYFYLSYWLDSREHGHGYMTEAVNAITRLCFGAYDAKRVQISASIKNPKSLGIPKRLNYHLEGELRNYSMQLTEKEVTNSHMYAVYSVSTLPDLDCKWEMCEVQP